MARWTARLTDTMSTATARPSSTREACILCGMVANVDPWLHASRYRHEPQIIRDGRRLVHNRRGAFVPLWTRSKSR